jgi:endoglucanase
VPTLIGVIIGVLNGSARERRYELVSYRCMHEDYLHMLSFALWSPLLSRFSARSLREILLIAALAALFVGPMLRAESEPPGTTAIKVDQVGYPIDGSKLAFVAKTAANDLTGRAFELCRVSDGSKAFSGKLSAPSLDSDSGDQVQVADFSTFKTPGIYYLDVPGVGRSWKFRIERNVFEHTYFMAMRGFYGQRCGTAVDMGAESPGFNHPACHLHGEFHPSSGSKGERDNIGGWHDAGDYGRYVVNSGISTGTLLTTWEMFAAKLKDIALKIPESGNGTPDILNEARWNLEWMLKMQDADGGVWHKQTSEHFSGFVAPQNDTLTSYVIGTGDAPYKSTCATADLAAVAAIAARVYQPFDRKFAAKNLEAARRAWAWAGVNPNVTFSNPAGVTTGDYGDGNCSDERLWAAAELFRTTGESAFNDYFLQNYGGFIATLDAPPAASWSQVSPMGLWSYAFSKQARTDPKVVDAIRRRTVVAARAVVDRTRVDPYRISMKARDYIWGSNGVAASYGMFLLIANRFEPDASFTDAARDNLHYILGRNTFSLSWVTQVGDNPFQHPHHRPSAASGAAWPGLMSGGPNAGRQDEVLKRLPEGLPPARVYADETASYASNEIAINWQAALVFLLAGELQ